MQPLAVETVRKIFIQPHLLSPTQLLIAEVTASVAVKLETLTLRYALPRLPGLSVPEYVYVYVWLCLVCLCLVCLLSAPVCRYTCLATHHLQFAQDAGGVAEVVGDLGAQLLQLVDAEVTRVPAPPGQLKRTRQRDGQSDARNPPAVVCSGNLPAGGYCFRIVRKN